jgi:hypothetical protein
MYFVSATRFPFSLETHLVLITGKFPALISKKKSVCPTFLQRIDSPFFECSFSGQSFYVHDNFCFVLYNRKLAPEWEGHSQNKGALG